MIPIILVLILPQTLKGTSLGLADPTGIMLVEDFLPMITFSEVLLHFEGTLVYFNLINLVPKVTFSIDMKTAVCPCHREAISHCQR
jgi:hypothetical protein